VFAPGILVALFSAGFPVFKQIKILVQAWQKRFGIYSEDRRRDGWIDGVSS
jgi:hypothetical protein